MKKNVENFFLICSSYFSKLTKDTETILPQDKQQGCKLQKLLFFSLPSFFFVASFLSVVDATSFSHFHPCVFFLPRPLSSTTSVVHLHCLFSSSSKAAKTTKTNMKSTSSQTNATITSYNAHSLKAAIFKTLAQKLWQRNKQWQNCSFNPLCLFSKSCTTCFSYHQKRSHLSNTTACIFRDPRLPFVKPSPITSLYSPIRLLTKTIFISYMQYKKL